MPSVELMEDLSVPYVLVLSSVDHSGTWVRRAEYPELPGCAAESYSALGALLALDELRVRMLVEMRRRGERPPRPRPPIESGLPVGAIDIDKFLTELLGEEPASKDAAS
jgi:hypothetical protein